MPLTMGTVQIFLSAKIVGVIGATAHHQVAMSSEPTTITYPDYLVEIDEEPGTYTNASVTYFDGTDYINADASPLPSGIHTGNFTLQAKQVIGTSVTMDGGWTGEPYHLSQATTAYAGGDDVIININNVAIAVQSMCVVGTTP